MKKVIFAISIILLCLSNAYASNSIKVDKQWARPSLGHSKNTAIYMDIINLASENDALISVETDIAESSEIHKSVNIDGVASMVKIDKLALPAKQTVTLKPRGLHIMLMKLYKPLNKGDKINLVFVFEKQGRMNVEIPVDQR
jgi:hypothetical protein